MKRAILIGILSIAVRTLSALGIGAGAVLGAAWGLHLGGKTLKRAKAEAVLEAVQAPASPMAGMIAMNGRNSRRIPLDLR